MKHVNLLVNGTDVSLNAFATRIILNLLTGILKSLTLAEEPKEAVFRITV